MSEHKNREKLGLSHGPRDERPEATAPERERLGEGWVLVSVGPFFYMGRVVSEASEELEGSPDETPVGDEGEDFDEDAPLLLNPCYRMHETTFTVNGKEQEGLSCMPYGQGLFGFSVTVELAHYDTRVDLGEIDEGDRQQLLALVQGAERMKTKVRQTRIGLVMPGGK